MTELHERLVAKNAELLQLSAKESELTNELNRVKWQDETEATVPHDLKLVVGACERPKKHARPTHQLKEYFITPLTAAFLALLAEKDDFENCCVAVTLESQCTTELAAEAQELQEKLADSEKAEAGQKLL